jgi:hypothetical protein
MNSDVATGGEAPVCFVLVDNAGIMGPGAITKA